MPQGPLSGYRVIDLSQVLSGPAATRMLADQGADVIKIEPFTGDITRSTSVGVNGMTAMHLNINRGNLMLVDQRDVDARADGDRRANAIPKLRRPEQLQFSGKFRVDRAGTGSIRAKCRPG